MLNVEYDENNSFFISLMLLTHAELQAEYELINTRISLLDKRRARGMDASPTVERILHTNLGRVHCVAAIREYELQI